MESVLFRINQKFIKTLVPNTAVILLSLLFKRLCFFYENHVLDFRKKPVLLETLISVHKTVKQHRTFRIHYLRTQNFRLIIFFIREDNLYWHCIKIYVIY